MKKRLFAVLIAAATIGAFAGGTTMLQANDNGAKLQIAGGETEASSKDQTESTGSSDSSSQSATEVAAALPSGNIAKADQPDVTEQQAENSGVSEVASDAMPALVSITNMSVQKVQDWFSGRT